MTSNNPKKQCLARTKTRAGGFCKSPPVIGKTRCRMHGGAHGSGAPKGNKNAFKHGYYSKESIDGRKEVNSLIDAYKRLNNELR